MPFGYTTKPQGTLTVFPSSVEKGKSMLLTWSAAGAKNCTISNTYSADVAGGSVSVIADKTGVYTLRCQGFDADGDAAGAFIAVSTVSFTVIIPDDDVSEECASGNYLDCATGSENRGTTEVVDTNLTYVPLEPLVGVNQTGKARFGELIGGFFRILVNVGAFLAVVVFVAGGITYMVSDSTFNKLKGKDQIKAALMGLGILAAAWLILNTINPQLITFDRDLLSPAPSLTVVEKDPTLIKNGVERRNITSSVIKEKINKEFGCSRNCTWDDMLIFDNKNATSKRVTEAITQYKSHCKGWVGNFSSYRPNNRPGTLVGESKNTTVYVCVANGVLTGND
jgi:hypothetical protein